jgi:hypothetical protein
MNRTWPDVILIMIMMMRDYMTTIGTIQDLCSQNQIKKYGCLVKPEIMTFNNTIMRNQRPKEWWVSTKSKRKKWIMTTHKFMMKWFYLCSLCFTDLANPFTNVQNNIHYFGVSTIVESRTLYELTEFFANAKHNCS